MDHIYLGREAFKYKFCYNSYERSFPPGFPGQGVEYDDPSLIVSRFGGDGDNKFMTERLNSFIEKITAKNSLVLVFLFCASVFAYGNILFGDFVFDDNIFIENNLQIRSPANVEQIYRSSTTAGSGLLNDNFYRPNQQFIYTLLHSAFGLNPFFFHFAPILLHVLNAFLVFILFIKLDTSRKFSFFGALIFLLHPILTESVSYVSGLSDPLVTITILLTILIFLKAAEEPDYKKYLKLLILGAVTFAIGLFSKENQIVALGLLPLLAIFQYKRGKTIYWKRSLAFFGALCLLGLVYIYARLTVLNFTGAIGLTGDSNVYTENLSVRIYTFIHVLPEYLKMLLWPWHLYYEKPYTPYLTLFSIQSILGMVIIIWALWAALYSLIKRSPARNAPSIASAGGGKIFLGIGWFFVAMIPFMGIVPLNATYLEHWLYVPIIGFIFMVVCWMEETEYRTKGKMVVILLCILVLFSTRIIARNMEWGNPIKFYENELKYTATSARIYNNLAMELADKGTCADAIPHYEKAIFINDSYPQTRHNLGNCLEELGKKEEAFAEYLKALYIQPNFPYSIVAITNMFSAAGDKRAEKFFQLYQKLQNGIPIERADIERALKPR